MAPEIQATSACNSALRQGFLMPITKHDQQALDQVHTDWSQRYKGRTEDYFALLYLTTSHGVDSPSKKGRINPGANTVP
jgi:hypothetical protein